MLYVTERCVFELTADGLELTEIAPGIDLVQDILAHMEFEPLIRKPKRMAVSIFQDSPMDLAHRFNASTATLAADKSIDI